MRGVVDQDHMRAGTPLFQRRLRKYQERGQTHGTEWPARRIDAAVLVVEYDEVR